MCGAWSSTVQSSPQLVAVEVIASNVLLTQRRLVRSFVRPLHVMKTTPFLEETQCHRTSSDHGSIAPRTQVRLEEMRFNFFPIYLDHSPPPTLCRAMGANHLSVHTKYSPANAIKQRIGDGLGLGCCTYPIRLLELSESASKNINLLVNWRVTPVLPQFGGGDCIKLEEHRR